MTLDGKRIYFASAATISQHLEIFITWAIKTVDFFHF
jgi:hypothetical protein